MLRATFTKRGLIVAALGLAIISASAPWSGPALAAGDPASARIDAFYAALLDAMKNAKTLGVKGRYEKLAPVVAKTFDVAGMAKGAVGAGWDAIPAPQQAATIEAFQRMMAATYASRFDDFTGEKFEVSPAVDQGADKLVKTKLVQSNGKPVTLNYLMRGADPKIADVFLDGTISELAGRRAEFTTILKSGGADALIASLKAKGDKYLAGS
jgi:phospholipid transport system substrate-binding protein